MHVDHSTVQRSLYLSNKSVMDTGEPTKKTTTAEMTESPTLKCITRCSVPVRSLLILVLRAVYQPKVLQVLCQAQMLGRQLTQLVELLPICSTSAPRTLEFAWQGPVTLSLLNLPELDPQRD